MRLLLVRHSSWRAPFESHLPKFVRLFRLLKVGRESIAIIRSEKKNTKKNKRNK